VVRCLGQVHAATGIGIPATLDSEFAEALALLVPLLSNLCLTGRKEGRLPYTKRVAADE